MIHFPSNPPPSAPSYNPEADRPNTTTNKIAAFALAIFASLASFATLPFDIALTFSLGATLLASLFSRSSGSSQARFQPLLPGWPNQRHTQRYGEEEYKGPTLAQRMQPQAKRKAAQSISSLRGRIVFQEPAPAPQSVPHQDDRKRNGGSSSSRRNTIVFPRQPQPNPKAGPKPWPRVPTKKIDRHPPNMHNARIQQPPRVGVSRDHKN
ncbi:MAG: hypothetical protein COT85_02135 [Chlamydiae bacterium CG10_big_fil_rev_8_21_14_0_10_42_34]|nr:MAG: hypothetical protein COT85_02135 [Chlamydiae bacterium CG10_big_fil_rev_8_21_14_0_10_42_34]